MTHQLKNRIKAVFLLLVFSVNTVAGFACSVGVDMGYNAHHHAHAKKHPLSLGKGHHHKHKHHHLKATTVFNDANTKDDCCSNDVTKFNLLDKAVAANNLDLQTPFFPLELSITFLPQAINESGLAVNPQFQFVRRSCFLNDTDIQTAIRRFQI
jgi:hypothetical protein